MAGGTVTGARAAGEHEPQYRARTGSQRKLGWRGAPGPQALGQARRMRLRREFGRCAGRRRGVGAGLARPEEEDPGSGPLGTWGAGAHTPSCILALEVFCGDGWGRETVRLVLCPGIRSKQGQCLCPGKVAEGMAT